MLAEGEELGSNALHAAQRKSASSRVGPTVEVSPLHRIYSGRPAMHIARNQSLPGGVTAFSLDHLVGAQQERLRNGEPERLGGLEIDGQIELRGLLHRQVSRLGALQDLVHIDGATAP
jgi:hypothetical protein